MDNLVVIIAIPSVLNRSLDSETVKDQFSEFARQNPLLAQAPHRLIIAPHPLPRSIANAYRNEVVEVKIQEENEESSDVKGNASTSLRKKDKLVDLKKYCEGLPEGKYALAVLSKAFYNGKVDHAVTPRVINWPYESSTHVSEMTIAEPAEVSKTDWGSYTLDDLQARLQLRGLAEAQRELRQRDEEIKQKETGFSLDSVRSALRELPGKLPAPTSCTLPRPPQLHPVEISTLQQSTEALLASVNLLKSKFHSST